MIQLLKDIQQSVQEPQYVLIHKDHTHVYPLPGGAPYHTKSKSAAELILKVAEKDLGQMDYYVCELKQALVHISMKQAQLEREWAPAIKQIRNAKDLDERFAVYKKARKMGPHPVLFDNELKFLLNI